MLLNARSLIVATLLSLTLIGCFKPATDTLPQPTGGGSAQGGGSGGAGGGGTPTVEPIALALQPAFLTVPKGSTAHFQVFSSMSDGTMTDVTSTVTLAAEPSGIVELTQGSVKGLAAGNVKLTAKLGKLEAIGGVEVPAAELVSISVEPQETSLGLGESKKLSVLGKLADGSRIDVTQSATFMTSSLAVGVDPAGIVIALAAGEATVTAKVATFTATAHFTVRAAKVSALRIDPTMPSLALGGTVQLKATATYDDASTADVTRSAQWSASNPAVTVDLDGLAHGVSAGTAAITATFQQATAHVDLTVRTATLVSVSVTPSTLTVPPRTVRQLLALGRYSDGASSDVTALVQWSSSAPGIAAVSNALGHQGEMSSLAAGSADLVARLGSVQGQAQLIVTPAMLVQLTVRPVNPTVRPGGTVQLSVEGTYSDESKVDLTAQATWSSLDTTIATVGNAGQGGLVTGKLAGSTAIRAQLGTVSGSAVLTVARQNPDSIEVAPANVSLEAGTTINLKAMAHYPDGLLEDVSELCTWASMPATVATVSNAAGAKGRVRGVTNGTATVEAVMGTLRASTTVTVSAPTVTGVSVYPATLRLPVGIHYGPTASVSLSDGSGGQITGYATWTSSNNGVARVMVYQQQNYLDLEAVAPGTATITASYMGFQASLTVTVTTAALTSLNVAPAQPSLAVGSSMNVAASGVFSDLTTQNLTWYASWTSSNPAVLSVGQDEIGYWVITGLAPGAATLTASYGGVSGSTTVTVTSATLSTIQVTPFAPRLPQGFDTYLRATGIYSDNTTRELTYQVSWSSSSQATAAVSTYGELQPLAAGTATLTANYQGVSGTTTVTVTSATLQSISVTPNMGSLGVGMEQPFAATGTFSDASTMDVTPYVTWLSSNRLVADVANAWPYQGSAKGLSAGTVTITAVRAGVTGNAGLMVH